MKSGKGGGNICNHLPGTQAQFKVFRKCSNLMSMEKRLGMLFLDQNYGNSSGKVKTWHISMISKYADPVGTRHTKKDTMLCAKDFRGKKIKKCEVWNCLCLSPNMLSWEKLEGCRCVFLMIPRQDYFIGTPDIAFILPWLDHPEERARSLDKAASERRNKDILWSLGWTTMGSSPSEKEPDPPLCWWLWPQGSPFTLTAAHVLPALHLLPEDSINEDLLLLSLQIQCSFYLEVNLAKISPLPPEHW